MVAAADFGLPKALSSKLPPRISKGNSLDSLFNLSALLNNNLRKGIARPSGVACCSRGFSGGSGNISAPEYDSLSLSSEKMYIIVVATDTYGNVIVIDDFNSVIYRTCYVSNRVIIIIDVLNNWFNSMG